MEDAVKDFYKIFWPCSYISNEDRCINVQRSHDKGHQNAQGHVLAVGDFQYERGCDMDAVARKFVEDIESAYASLLKEVPTSTQKDVKYPPTSLASQESCTAPRRPSYWIKQRRSFSRSNSTDRPSDSDCESKTKSSSDCLDGSEGVSESTIRRSLASQKKLEALRKPPFTDLWSKTQAKLVTDHKTCFVCLLSTPEHVLSCGHILCDGCAQDFADYCYNSQSSQFECDAYGIKYCPLCQTGGAIQCSDNQEWLWLQPLSPPAAGPRILTLDG